MMKRLGINPFKSVKKFVARRARRPEFLAKYWFVPRANASIKQLISPQVSESAAAALIRRVDDIRHDTAMKLAEAATVLTGGALYGFSDKIGRTVEVLSAHSAEVGVLGMALGLGAAGVHGVRKLAHVGQVAARHQPSELVHLVIDDHYRYDQNFLHRINYVRHVLSDPNNQDVKDGFINYLGRHALSEYDGEKVSELFIQVVDLFSPEELSDLNYLARMKLRESAIRNSMSYRRADSESKDLMDRLVGNLDRILNFKTGSDERELQHFQSIRHQLSNGLINSAAYKPLMRAYLNSKLSKSTPIYDSLKSAVSQFVVTQIRQKSETIVEDTQVFFNSLKELGVPLETIAKLKAVLVETLFLQQTIYNTRKYEKSDDVRYIEKVVAEIIDSEGFVETITPETLKSVQGALREQGVVQSYVDSQEPDSLDVYTNWTANIFENLFIVKDGEQIVKGPHFAVRVARAVSYGFFTLEKKNEIKEMYFNAIRTRAASDSDRFEVMNHMSVLVKAQKGVADKTLAAGLQLEWMEQFDLTQESVTEEVVASLSVLTPEEYYQIMANNLNYGSETLLRNIQHVARAVPNNEHIQTLAAYAFAGHLIDQALNTDGGRLDLVEVKQSNEFKPHAEYLTDAVWLDRLVDSYLAFTSTLAEAAQIIRDNPALANCLDRLLQAQDDDRKTDIELLAVHVDPLGYPEELLRLYPGYNSASAQLYDRPRVLELISRMSLLGESDAATTFILHSTNVKKENHALVLYNYAIQLVEKIDELHKGDPSTTALHAGQIGELYENLSVFLYTLQFSVRTTQTLQLESNLLRALNSLLFKDEDFESKVLRYVQQRFSNNEFFVNFIAFKIGFLGSLKRSLTDDVRVRKFNELIAGYRAFGVDISPSSPS